MIGSRIRRRRTTKTITVKSKTLASGQYTEANSITGLTATHEPFAGDEIISDAGAIVIATDVFWFEQVSGTLPAINENHVLIDSGSIRYEVVAKPVNQAGNGNRLKVLTRRVNN